MKFDIKWADWEKEIVLEPTDNMDKKYAFVQNLYDKACEKINHFDKLRQQNLNYALVIFSGLIAFILQTKGIEMKLTGCVGVILLILIFCFLDHRLHKYTHGFTSSMLILAHVMAIIIDRPKKKIEFYQYYKEGEKEAKFWKSRQTRIYCLLILVAIILGFVLYFKN